MARNKRTARTTRTTRTTRNPRAARKPAASPIRALEAVGRNAALAVDALIQRGVALQQEGRNYAIAKTQEARDAMLARAGEARVRTVDAVSQLEKVFENRVTRAISRLGVPTARDVRALSRQVAQLQQSVEQLRRARARA
jgi:poly(hydroxyalkanoate) granule-associated protein